MENEHILQSQLEEYCKSGPYPMHMPGHKRQLSPAPGLPYQWDLTEVEGVDDLHHAEGILRNAMGRTADLWKSRRTWYLVNGSTCGILASIYAAVPRGGEVILARNCHKSVCHAAEILDLGPHWMMPEYVTDWNIFGSIRPESVREMIRQYPGSRAVVLTSPTYEGVVSDIRAIAEICHEAEIPLIVDEAHGAHFGLFQEGEFRDSAVHLGADLVIQSAHKTLPSLTQTALLHMGEHSLVSGKAVDHALDLFETSSPSYPLMASLDGCTGILRERGPQLFAEWRKGIRQLEEVLSGLQRIEAFGHTRTAGSSPHRPAPDTDTGTQRVWAYDDSRFLLRARKDLNVTGEELAVLLRTEFSVESEMHCGGNALLMTGAGDSAEGYTRVGRALERLDKILSGREHITGSSPPGNFPEAGHSGVSQPGGLEKRGKTCRAVSGGSSIVSGWQIETACPIGRAEEQAGAGQAEEIPLREAAGRISAEYVMAYPPGIPILIPGECITDAAIRAILYLKQQGANMIWSVSEKHAESEEPVVAALRQEG